MPWRYGTPSIINGAKGIRMQRIPIVGGDNVVLLTGIGMPIF